MQTVPAPHVKPPGQVTPATMFTQQESWTLVIQTQVPCCCPSSFWHPPYMWPLYQSYHCDHHVHSDTKAQSQFVSQTSPSCPVPYKTVAVSAAEESRRSISETEAARATRSAQPMMSRDLCMNRCA